tara:strand:- start:2035 stop:2901 length:867 start_codon:yes stop_codon:yes gene_type:complete
MQEEIVYETKTKGISWTPVPKEANDLLKALNTWCYGWGDGDERRKKELCNLSKESIDCGVEWLNKHKDYTITHCYTNYGNRETHMVCKKPFLEYATRDWSYPYRGRTATYYNNQKRVSKHLQKWLQLIGEHWNMRDSVHKEKEHAIQLRDFNSFKYKLERLEEEVRSTITEEEIAEAALSTFNKYRCGNSSSSHGRFGFALNYNTYFIDEGGIIIEWDEKVIDKKFEKCFEDITLEEFTSQKPAMKERFMTAYKKLFEASVAWSRVMNTVYDELEEICFKIQKKEIQL